jgi:NAD(P)-dependent dehydrogenase (short-subunit alcohol dehydrogenase family)
MSKVWLITGSGNGLGRDIAEAALAADDRVVAGARRTEELASLVAQYGERVKPVKLEVRYLAAAKAAVQLAVDTFGRLDVLVNNTGYGQFAPFEQMSAGDFQAIVDTCFYGVVYTTRAAVPVMRTQKGGHIFQVSSVGGRLGVPGNTPYHAAKWAVGGFSDSIDTRHVGNGQPFTGELTVDVVDSACGPPSTAEGYVFNATVVPTGSLGYLTLWPDSENKPVVSTLNALDGAITSNMAVVPNVNGKTDAFASGVTQLILDIAGYFAP